MRTKPELTTLHSHIYAYNILGAFFLFTDCEQFYYYIGHKYLIFVTSKLLRVCGQQCIHCVNPCSSEVIVLFVS